MNRGGNGGGERPSAGRSGNEGGRNRETPSAGRGSRREGGNPEYRTESRPSPREGNRNAGRGGEVNRGGGRQEPGNWNGGSRGRNDDYGRYRESNRNEYRYSNRNDYRSGYRNDYRNNDYGRRSSRTHYYGSGGYGSLYFWLGSGYRYGSSYSGRVYGYRGRSAGYGSYQYYGDVRLLVKPRDAEVYVDGYYAGIVDSFDGFFQRLTLEVGPHEIEISAPGLESMVYNVYVDPTRTVDVHGDLYPLER